MRTARTDTGRAPAGLSIAVAATRRGLTLAVVIALFAAPAPAAPAHAPDWSRAHHVTVLARDYRFVPNRLVFRRDVPYRLHLTNRGTAFHEFTARDFFRAVRLGNPQALSADGTELVVAPGEQKDLYFVPLVRGRYRFTCADHDWLGMTGEIIVE